TPLHLAVCWSKKDVVELLLARGASPDVTCTQHPTAPSVLHSAAGIGHTRLVEYLVDSAFDIHSTDISDMSPIWYAYLRGNWDTVKTLIHHGSDV
ncbi:ankyrin repeat-containing domain protein, partial [Podospora appendiculata]